MATSPRETAFELLEQPARPTLAASAPKKRSLASSPGGLDALQALLAFSSLHEQVRTKQIRGTEAGEGKGPLQGSPDEFVLYDVLQLVAERALALTDADGAAIALVQEGEIICRAASGDIAPTLGARLDLHAGISGACFRAGEVARCDDAESDPRVNREASLGLRAKSMLAVPLLGKRSVIGLIEVFSKDSYAFSEGDVRSLQLLAELILGAMKPEEEDELEALSPAPLAPVPCAPPVLPVKDSEEIQDGKAEVDSKAIGATTEGLVAESAPEIEEKVAYHDFTSEAKTQITEIAPKVLPVQRTGNESRSGLVIVASIIVAAASLGGGLWWFLHKQGENAASESIRPAAAASPAEQSSPTLPASQTPVLPASSALPQPSPTDAAEMSRSVLPLVSGVRHWESGDSTTVVIDLQDQVQYEVHRLSSPERIYFDLHDTVLASGISGKTIDVGDTLLGRIRVAQPMPGVSRVVLETKNVSNFSVSLEPNPYRLVIEIRSSSSNQQPKAGIEFLRPSAPPAGEKLSSALAPPSKEDLQLRARVPHMKIVVDPGHGGWDRGAVGRLGVTEKDLVLDVSKRLGALLEKRLGSEVLYTRPDDSFIPLEQRADLANEAQADLFISVHANNSDYPSARGIETYYTNVSAPANSLDIEKRENGTAKLMTAAAVSDVAMKERAQESRRLAASVESTLYNTLSSKNTGVRDRGVKKAAFVVLTNTSMPAILAEISFVSSPADERNLQSKSYRESIAEALYKGIARYAAASGRTKMASAASRATAQ
ncbi:MAG TPA: N-acetylmuramoyl-L-alanine amidase [Terriglobales bacterium]|nr:N-acetylmuramoyl-L-alanine amidase [Terriglobales bacterium]